MQLQICRVYSPVRLSDTGIPPYHCASFLAGVIMRVLLAPMEGVLDSLVRELLTEVNDYDLCITEFLRVVDQLLPAKSFYRLCPELHHASRTPSGTLVRIQLLGQHPQWLGENAARAVELGSYEIGRAHV